MEPEQEVHSESRALGAGFCRSSLLLHQEGDFSLFLFLSLWINPGPRRKWLVCLSCDFWSNWGRLTDPRCHLILLTSRRKSIAADRSCLDTFCWTREGASTGSNHLKFGAHIGLVPWDLLPSRSVEFLLLGEHRSCLSLAVLCSFSMSFHIYKGHRPQVGFTPPPSLRSPDQLYYGQARRALFLCLLCTQALLFAWALCALSVLPTWAVRFGIVMCVDWQGRGTEGRSLGFEPTVQAVWTKEFCTCPVRIGVAGFIVAKGVLLPDLAPHICFP